MLGSTVLRAPDDGGKIRSLETKKGINSQVSYLLLLYLQACVREVKGQSFGTPSSPDCSWAKDFWASQAHDPSGPGGLSAPHRTVCCTGVNNSGWMLFPGGFSVPLRHRRLILKAERIRHKGMGHWEKASFSFPDTVLRAHAPGQHHSDLQESCPAPKMNPG